MRVYIQSGYVYEDGKAVAIAGEIINRNTGAVLYHTGHMGKTMDGTWPLVFATKCCVRVANERNYDIVEGPGVKS